jgi:hypothetical protein
MALRKRYRERIESPDAPPISTAPVSVSVPSMDAADDVQKETSPAGPKPPEQSATEPSPADKAAQDAIALQLRLREMERAENLQHEAASQPQQHPQLATEPQQASAEKIIEASGLPERAKTWLREHPTYITDSTLNTRLQQFHPVAEHLSGERFTDKYFNQMDALLFKKDSGNGVPQQPPAQRNPPQPQRYTGPTLSAPPTREVPSMSSGRPQSHRAPLTQEQKDMAKASGISEQEYARQLERMLRLQQAGAIQ